MSVIHDKRQSNNYQTGYEIRQKLRINTVLESKYRERKSIICIENFPNELFYEIFDYLDGYEIYQSFSNLNLRFQHLLSSSILPLKINLSPFLDTNIQQDCLEIISKQKSHIISLCLMYTLNIDRFFTLISFDSSFLRLESLIVVGLKSDDLFKYLSILTLLPRLTSFILCVSYNLKDFHHIYKLIFNLSVLKYIKFSSEAYEPIIPLTIANKNQFSSIEYLIINHSCNIYDLISILSYTPRLNRLICRELIKSTENIIQEPMIINLSNLTYICISECYIIFDILELFLKKMISLLKILRIHTYWDVNYLDANRWEELIINSMPYLKEFHLEHHEFIDDDFQITEFHTLINRYFSSFWIKREYMFALTIDINDWSWNEIIYSIHPYKQKKSNELTEISSENIELDITISYCRECNELFTDNTIYFLNLLSITRLNISYNGFSINTFIDLLKQLSNLHSLTIRSLSLVSPFNFDLSLKINKITKIIIQSLTDLSQLQFLIDLCPNLQYLQIDCLNHIDLKLILKFILTKKIHYITQLSILCFYVSTMNDNIIQELQDIINSEKLYHNYTINNLYNKIYLNWK